MTLSPTSESSPDAAGLEFIFLIRHCASLMSRALEAQCSAATMSYTQWAVLACLSQHVGAMSPSDLREALGHDPGALTRVVDALQKKGFINRKRSRTDRRGVVIDLSPEGAKLARSLNDQIMRAMNSWLAPLPHGEADALVSGLQRFLSTLRLSLCGEA